MANTTKLQSIDNNTMATNRKNNMYRQLGCFIYQRKKIFIFSRSSEKCDVSNKININGFVLLPENYSYP